LNITMKPTNYNIVQTSALPQRFLLSLSFVVTGLFVVRLRIPKAMVVAALLLSATAAPKALTREAVESGLSTISFETRLASQRAIEEVYWKHRIWPAENPKPKPALEAVMPLEAIRAKVEDNLRLSNALEAYWGQAITG